jgi:hypothetical protein
MATSLENQYIDESYQKLVQITGSTIADGTGSAITYLDISASYAVSASVEITKEVSSSYADFASTASYALSAPDTTFPYQGNAAITGSLGVQQSGSSYAIDSVGNIKVQGTNAAIDVVDISTGKTAVIQSDQVYIKTTATDVRGPIFDENGILLVSKSSDPGISDKTVALTTKINPYSPTFDTDWGLKYHKSISEQYDMLTVNTSTDVMKTNLALSSSNSITASAFKGDGSGVTGVISASYAVTASYALSTEHVSASYATSASHAENADTALSANTSTTAAFASAAATASYVDYTNVANKPTLVSSSAQIDLAQAFGTASQALTASYIDAANISGSITNAEFAEYANNTIVYGKNLTGGIISKGTPLYFTASGTSGNTVGVYPADAGNPARMPAGGVAGQDIAIAGEGRVFLDGFLNGVDTSAFNSGDAVYVAVGGGYTNIKPTGSANLIQALGYVEKSDINGSGVIQGSGRANDVPNITQDYTWVGNADGVATATAVNTLSVATASYVDYSNVANKPTLLSSSAQIASDISGSFTAASSSLATRITSQENFSSSLNATFATDAELNAATASLSSSLAVDIAKNTITGSDQETRLDALEGKSLVSASVLSSAAQGQVKLTTNGVDGSIVDLGLESTDSPTFGGLTVSGSLKVTGSSHTIKGNLTQTGYTTQNFNAPGTNQEVAFFNVNGSQVSGKNYNRVFYGQADYPSFGLVYNDYFALEYYDGFGYNFGTELAINGKQAAITAVPSGSGFSKRASIAVADNYNGTSLANIFGDNTYINGRDFLQLNTNSGAKVLLSGGDVQISGSTGINVKDTVTFNETIKLTAQNPLPAGAVGELAVSASNLYYHNGTSWSQIN